ncbi:MAG: pyridoxal-phosphate-dependent aminotransferase family protein [Methylococcaceae bacterium]
MLFTPGPTEIEADLRAIAEKPLPYFRHPIYSDMILELTDGFKYLFQTEQAPLILTASGTGVMEMAIQNLTNTNDKVVVLNCGTFGQKWVQMCQAFGLEVVDIEIPFGQLPNLTLLENVLTDDVSALFVTAHETSTGLLNDIQAIGEITHKKDILYIVDAVSSIGADTFYMDKWHCDCAIVSSQKALACIPGISSIAFSEKAWDVIPSVKRHRYYFDATEYANNATRGMLPYTPAMNVTYMLYERFKRIQAIGLDEYICQHAVKANAFREKLLSIGDYSLFAERMTNSLTSVVLPESCKMHDVIEYIRNKYEWYVAPNPTQDESYLRVSHMGDLSVDNLVLLAERIDEACDFLTSN